MRPHVFSLVVALVLSAGAAAHAEPAAPQPRAGAGTFWVMSSTHIGAAAQTRPLQGIRGPRIAPDGSRVVFAAMGDLWIVDLDEKLLAQDKAPRGRHLFKDEALDVDPAWSPDGMQLAFVSDRSGKPEIWVRDMKTGKDRQLTTSDTAVEGPSWSPDGKRIAFFEVPTVGDPSVKALNVVTVFTGDIMPVRSQVRTAGAPTWSPDGKTLALKVSNDQPGAHAAPTAKWLLISLAGASDRFVAPAGLSSQLSRGSAPVWSPDGTKIAYVNDGFLWVAPVVANGARAGEIAGEPRALTTELSDSPSWMGDSKTLLYVATDRMKRVTLDGAAKDLQPNLMWDPNVARGRTVVWAGRLWDGTGAGYKENVDIVIDGGVITAVEPHAPRDDRTHVINASKQTVIPGLIDSQVRLSSSFGERLGRLLLSYGITSVREWGVDPYGALERRESWASGRRPGPRDFFTSMFTGEGADEAHDTHFNLEMERAKHLGYDIAVSDPRVIARAPDAVIRRPVTLGLSGDVTQVAAVQSMTIIPDLARAGGFPSRVRRMPALLRTPQFAALYSETEQTALKDGIDAGRSASPDQEKTLAANENLVRGLMTRDVRVVLGSGAPDVPYGLGLLVECELAQESGWSSAQVLRSVTSGAAAALGVDQQLGTVTPGKLADLAIINGDPMTRLSDLANVSGVVANGHYYIIDELLEH